MGKGAELSGYRFHYRSVGEIVRVANLPGQWLISMAGRESHGDVFAYQIEPHDQAAQEYMDGGALVLNRWYPPEAISDIPPDRKVVQMDSQQTPDQLGPVTPDVEVFAVDMPGLWRVQTVTYTESNEAHSVTLLPISPEAVKLCAERKVTQIGPVPAYRVYPADGWQTADGDALTAIGFTNGHGADAPVPDAKTTTTNPATELAAGIFLLAVVFTFVALCIIFVVWLARATGVLPMA